MKKRQKFEVGGRKPEVRTHGLCILLLTSCCLFSFGVDKSFSQTRPYDEWTGFGKLSTRLELADRLLKSSDQNVSTEQGDAKRKSPGLAAFTSLAVPGLGELYAGRYDVGKYSTIAEVSLWVFYTAVEVYSEQVHNDAISYAKIYAGAQVVGKPDQFFVDIGNFLNTSDYNIAKISDGSNDLIYTSPSSQWQWRSDAELAEFKNLRIKADEFLNYGRYTAAVIIFNHIISAFNAARLTAGVNASAATSLDNSPQTSGLYLKLAASF